MLHSESLSTNYSSLSTLLYTSFSSLHHLQRNKADII